MSKRYRRRYVLIWLVHVVHALLDELCLHRKVIIMVYRISAGLHTVLCGRIVFLNESLEPSWDIEVLLYCSCMHNYVLVWVDQRN